MSASWAVLAFWLGLALPGFAVLWRWDRAALANGGLSSLARAYLVSLVLLTPVSVVGHIARLPLWTLSGAYLVLVALAVISLALDRSWWRPRWPALAAVLGSGLLAFDMWLGSHAGAHLEGDAAYHIARVRLLLEVGLNSWDPSLTEPRIDYVYHTNLYQALIACSAQLTRSDPLLAWLEVWPFAKLLAAAGAYELAMALFARSWIAWLAAITVGVWHAPAALLPLPNTLAPVAVLPLGIAAAIDACGAAPSFRPALRLGAAAVVLAQLHALNAIFLALGVGPVLLAVLVYRRLRKREGQRQLLAAVLALGTSLPWLLVPGLPRVEAWLLPQHETVRVAPNNPAPAAPQPETKSPRPERKADQFIVLDNGQRMIKPGMLWGASELNLLGCGALALAFVQLRRKQLATLLACFAVIAVWLLVPGLCTLLARALGAPWVLTRFAKLLNVAAWLLPAALAALLPRRHFANRAAVRIPVEAVCCALSIAYAADTTFLDFAGYWTAASDERSHTAWEQGLARSAFLRANIPAGATVMASTRWDYELPMHHRCHTLATAIGRGFHGIGDMGERRAEVGEFFDRHTSRGRRLEILRSRGIHHVYATRGYAAWISRSLREHVIRYDAYLDNAVLTVE